jgi:tetratricopeptide (TPR) repeat protein
LEKAIEIKRRAQRCIQNGDLDGALGEYEKLVAADDSDPYNLVLLADLLYKKGDHAGAGRRYLAATAAYEKTGLYKNAIAICKKMMRLSLSHAQVLQRLAVLHGLDGLTTESALYHMQYADLLLREDKTAEAATALRAAFEVCPENIKALERLADVLLMDGDKDAAAKALAEAAQHYQSAGQAGDADRCRGRLAMIKPGGVPARAAEPATRAAASPTTRQALDDTLLGVTPLEPEPHAAHGHLGASARTAPPAAAQAAHREMAAGPAAAATPPPALTEEGLEIETGYPSAAAPAAREAPAESAPAPAPRATPPAPDGPGLAFDAPALARARAQEMEPASQPAAAGAPSRPAPVEAAAPAAPTGHAKIEKLLTLAQEQFRLGRREVATSALVEAASAYEELGQYDNAATIYRSLSKSAHAATDVMMLWMKNCEVRRDLVEAALVACELGDLALNEGDLQGARSWFKRATTLDATNALAHRRLQRLGDVAPAPEVVAAIAPAATVPAAAARSLPAAAFEAGRVEVEVGRGGAVTFDLGSLVSEFQRGIEAQISGDAQGNYDLAMTYREMGLLEQAIEAFRTAARDPAFVVRCTEMVGRCLLDEGRFDEAAREFTRGLEVQGLSPMAKADLRYQLGLAQEAAGHTAAALAEFERVYAMHASYPDVALKIRVLRKALEHR